MNHEQITRVHTALYGELYQRFSYDHPHCGMAPSKAIGNDYQTIENLLLKNEFVQKVLSNDDPAWEMPMTLTRYLAPRLTPVGRDLYHLLPRPMALPNVAWHEMGVCQQLFNRVAEEMELYSAALAQNPLLQRHDQSPREGEYLNSVVDRIRKLGREQKFEDMRKERERSARRQLREARKLISALSSNVNALFGQWITLEYKFSDTFPQKPNQFESDAHLNGFRDGLQDMANQLRSLGQIWMRHYLPETGFRIRMLLLNEPQVIAPRTDWVGFLTALWTTVTNGCGEFTLDPNLLGSNAIEQALKIHVLSDMVIRSASGSDALENFGCFDSSDMCLRGLPAPQSPVANEVQSTM